LAILQPKVVILALERELRFQVGENPLFDRRRRTPGYRAPIDHAE
jgi:hypothetical protein